MMLPKALDICGRMESSPSRAGILGSTGGHESPGKIAQNENVDS